MDPFVVVVVGCAVVTLVILSCCTDDGRASALSASSRRSRARIAPHELRLVAGFSILEPADAFDPGRAVIWSTQILALRFVREQEPKGVSWVRLRLVHMELAQRYPEIYDGHGFGEWAAFLVSMGLFRLVEESVHIAPPGRDLLDFLATTMRRQARQTSSRPAPAQIGQAPQRSA